MSDDYKVQLSVKLDNGNDMLNIRGNTTEEVDAQLTGAKELLLPSLAGFKEDARAIGLIAQAFPGTQAVPQPQQQWGHQPAQMPAAGPTGGARSCAHGPMVWREGAGWKGWFCPARRDDPSKCKPQYER